MGNRIELLPGDGKYYKANLHCHTTISDGRLTPEEVKEAYKNQGYQVVAFTDHRKYIPHLDLKDEGFLALAGVEVDINELSTPKEWKRVKKCHLNFYDKKPWERAEEKAQLCTADIWNYDIGYINSFIKRMNGLGFLACCNHPYWSLQTVEDYASLEGLFAMEIYNHGCEIYGMYGYAPQAYEEMLRAGKQIFCVASDDNHNAYPFGDSRCDSFGGYTMLCAEEFSYEGIVESLEKGRFYSSTGAEIRELFIEDHTLAVKTSPAVKIYVQMRGKDCYKAVAEPGAALTEARFPLRGDEGYVRVTVLDTQGKRAYSNAYFLA